MEVSGQAQDLKKKDLNIIIVAPERNTHLCQAVDTKQHELEVVEGLKPLTHLLKGTDHCVVADLRRSVVMCQGLC